MISDYLDPNKKTPEDRPDLSSMDSETRTLHESIDDACRRGGIPYLHPRDKTVQLDLINSDQMAAWQEGKVNFMFLGEGCWSELPQVYARYGTHSTKSLLDKVRELEQASCAVLADCGMQATTLLIDAVLVPDCHAILMRQVYNKTRKYLERQIERLGGRLTIVDDGDFQSIRDAINEKTRLIFAETFTNPLMRAQDIESLADIAKLGRKTSPAMLLTIDNTIATPWGPKKPLLTTDGVDVIVASGTKALGGQDRDMWGYVASNDAEVMNAVMDLQAMRGGILDWRRADVIAPGLEKAQQLFEKRCASAVEIARFLEAHPRVEEVFHPSLDKHVDAAVIEQQYRLLGSLLSFRLGDASEQQTRHFTDVLASCIVPRYALSFDGWVTKVNHHKTVSEYFSPEAELRRNGFQSLVRLAVGIEKADDVIACLNWALCYHDEVSKQDLESWAKQRRRSLGIND